MFSLNAILLNNISMPLHFSTFSMCGWVYAPFSKVIFLEKLILWSSTISIKFVKFSMSFDAYVVGAYRKCFIQNGNLLHLELLRMSLDSRLPWKKTHKNYSFSLSFLSVFLQRNKYKTAKCFHFNWIPIIQTCTNVGSVGWLLNPFDKWNQFQRKVRENKKTKNTKNKVFLHSYFELFIGFLFTFHTDNTEVYVSLNQFLDMTKQTHTHTQTTIINVRCAQIPIVCSLPSSIFRLPNRMKDWKKVYFLIRRLCMVFFLLFICYCRWFVSSFENPSNYKFGRSSLQHFFVSVFFMWSLYCSY